MKVRPLQSPCIARPPGVIHHNVFIELVEGPGQN
jgi:hypothetical protein